MGVSTSLDMNGKWGSAHIGISTYPTISLPLIIFPYPGPSGTLPRYDGDGPCRQKVTRSKQL
jgi:hypothetical protein